MKKLTITLIAVIVGFTITSCQQEFYDCNVGGRDTQCVRWVSPW